MLYITPLLFAVQFANVHSPSVVETLQTALSSSLFGGFAALLVVGIQISRAARSDNAHVTPEALFPSRLGSSFALLDPDLQWVHGGESRDLSGTVTVERGTSFFAKVLGALTSLPPTFRNAPIQIRIEIARDKERWMRTYASTHVMTSTLYKDGGSLVEGVGPAALTFRITARNAGMDWQHASLRIHDMGATKR